MYPTLIIIACLVVTIIVLEYQRRKQATTSAKALREQDIALKCMQIALDDISCANDVLREERVNQDDLKTQINRLVFAKGFLSRKVERHEKKKYTYLDEQRLVNEDKDRDIKRLKRDNARLCEQNQQLHSQQGRLFSQVSQLNKQCTLEWFEQQLYTEEGKTWLQAQSEKRRLTSVPIAPTPAHAPALAPAPAFTPVALPAPHVGPVLAPGFVPSPAPRPAPNAPHCLASGFPAGSSSFSAPSFGPAVASARPSSGLVPVSHLANQKINAVAPNDLYNSLQTPAQYVSPFAPATQNGNMPKMNTGQPFTLATTNTQAPPATDVQMKDSAPSSTIAPSSQQAPFNTSTASTQTFANVPKKNKGLAFSMVSALAQASSSSTMITTAPVPNAAVGNQDAMDIDWQLAQETMGNGVRDDWDVAMTGC